jgi:dolichol-phosphate mannosyltransferase
VQGGEVIDYPRLKLFLNRIANKSLQLFFRIERNDITNAFKGYRKTTIDGCRPLRAPHFNLTVEIPLKAVVWGYTWKSLPITWCNRRTGDAKLKINEMGSGYLLTCWHIWLEKYVTRRDHQLRSTKQVD